MRIAVFLMMACWLAVGPRPVFGQQEAPSPAVELSRADRDVLAKAAEAQEKGDLAAAAGMLRKLVASYANAGKEADVEQASAPSLAHLLLGNVLFESGKMQQAAQAYAAGFAAYPDEPALCRNLAVARSELNEHAASAQLFERAYELDPQRSGELLFQAAAGWYRAEKPGQSVRVLDRLLATTAKPQERWLELLAHCCLESGDTRRARRVLEDLVARFPAKPRHWRSLARVRLLAKDYAAAAAALEVYSRLPAKGANRDRAAELDELASLYMYLDAPLRAAETLERAHGKMPGDPKALDTLFEAYARAGRMDAALAVMDHALKSAPTAKRYRRKGHFLYDCGRFADAVAAYGEALRLNPKDAGTAMRAGYGALEIDDLTAARRFFRQAARSSKHRKRAEGGLKYVAQLEKARAEAATVAASTDSQSSQSESGGPL